MSRSGQGLGIRDSSVCKVLAAVAITGVTL